ncbi:MAG: FAD-dependent oxidoreductase [Niveispirillum sp.]|nr:FAD-dependent oxidoreductase [Niveispirillum sp.]
MQHSDIIIVGTGHAGAQTALLLRQRHYAGSILMLGEEADPPYERPPLSKDYLAGEKPLDRILLRPVAFWAEREVDLRLGRRVVVVDPILRQIRTDNGEVYAYETLVWAAGGHARPLSCPGHDLAGIHMIRTRVDVDRLRAELPGTDRVAVIGGGYVGLEAAAILVKAGKQVTVIEAQDRVLAHVAGEPLSRFYEREHRSHGVDLRLGATVSGIVGRDGRATAVKLSDGTEVPADMVVVGIGIVPAVEPLLAAGATGGNGIDVDGLCRTSLAGIHAIGDCAAQVSTYADGTRLRIESVQNAMEQAAIVGRHLTGAEEAVVGVPTFWSNQYDLRLQTVGLSLGHDRTIVRGRPTDRSFSVVYLRRGKVIALDCVNATRDFVQGKNLVATGARIASDQLSDATVPLKELSA